MNELTKTIFFLSLALAGAVEAKLAPPKLEDYTHVSKKYRYVETNIVSAARRQIGVTLGYDPTYRKIAYPGGDVPRSSGVCTDVIIRALRDARKIDLQKLVHEDMKANFSKYPRMWGLKVPDANIDHRREEIGGGRSACLAQHRLGHAGGRHPFCLPPNRSLSYSIKLQVLTGRVVVGGSSVWSPCFGFHYLKAIAQ